MQRAVKLQVLYDGILPYGPLEAASFATSACCSCFGACIIYVAA